MTRARIFASGTHDDPVILSHSQDEPEVSQQVTPKEETTVINPPLLVPGPLILLLVAYLAWSLELD